MKEINAVIQPFMLHRELDALHEVPAGPAVTVSEVQGINVERGRHEPVKKTKLEIMVPEDLAERVLTAIQRTPAPTSRASGAFVCDFD